MRIVPRVLECQNRFFKFAIDDESFNSKKLTDFADVTKQKMLTNSAFIQRAKQKWIARRAGATVEPLQNVRSIGFVAKFGETSLLATEVGSDSVANGEHIEVLTGRMRCMKADLIVVEKLLVSTTVQRMRCYVTCLL